MRQKWEIAFKGNEVSDERLPPRAGLLVFSPIFIKLAQIVYHDKILTPIENGWVGSKTRSLGQIKVKPCVHSRSHIFSPIFIKLTQIVYHDKIFTPIENGRGRVQIIRSNQGQTFCKL